MYFITKFTFHISFSRPSTEKKGSQRQAGKNIHENACYIMYTFFSILLLFVSSAASFCSVFWIKTSIHPSIHPMIQCCMYIHSTQRMLALFGYHTDAEERRNGEKKINDFFPLSPSPHSRLEGFAAVEDTQVCELFSALVCVWPECRHGNESIKIHKRMLNMEGKKEEGQVASERLIVLHSLAPRTPQHYSSPKRESFMAA